MKPGLEAPASRDGDRITVRSPGVGLYVDAPAVGSVVTPKGSLGDLVTLGRRTALRAPATVAGRVVEVGGGGRERVIAVGYDDVLLVLDASAGAGLAADAVEAVVEGGDAGLVFCAPSSGRFYSRPDPSKPPFVSVGDVIERGHSVCMLEVMKTYSRVRYDGDGVPDRARVVAIRPIDEDDIGEGDVILELEPV